MRYNDDSYEDELDRLRARRQRKKNGQQPAVHRNKPAFRIYDDVDDLSYEDEEDGIEFEELDLDEDGFYDDYEDDYEDSYENGYGNEDDRYHHSRYGEKGNGGYRDRAAVSPMRQNNIRSKESGSRNSGTEGSRTGGSGNRNHQNMRNGTGAPAEHNSGRRRAAAVSERPMKKKRKKKGFLKVLLLVAVLLAGYFLFQWVRDDSYWTIAVYGVDSRDGSVGKGAHSDVEMLCSINKKTGEIRLVSVFRDSYLRIDQQSSYNKINQAYFDGGYKQATDALRDNLDLQIDDYATFNWKAVVDAINVLGGVDIDITDKEFAYINSFITETVNSTGVGSVHLERSGMNHLDGVQAVAYARLRLMDTDFNRTERQRKVLGLVMEKAKNADFDTLKTLVGAVYPQVSTSVGVDDLIGMAKNARKYYIGQTSGFPFSHQEMKVEGKSCVIPTTLESNVIQLHTFLYDNTQYTPSSDVKKISAHISEVTGLGDPGKDTESGKNVGVEGNSGGGQGGGQSSQTQAPAAPSETAPPETEPVTAESESETEPESSTEAESSESASTEPSEPEDSTRESSSGVVDHPGAEPGNGTQTGPGADINGTGSAGSSQSGSTQGGTSQTPEPSKAPEPPTTGAPAQTNASLEAPGQNNNGADSGEPGPSGPGV